MNDLIKRKKDLDAEFEQIMEMEDDAVNVKSTMTIAAVAKLLNLLNEHITDMAEIANKAEYYDPKLTTSLQDTVSKLVEAFSQIQPPTIKVTPNINIDFKPLVDKITSSNDLMISLLNKYFSNNSNGQNEQLYKLILSVVEKQNNFLDREFKQTDITKNLVEIKDAISNRPTEFKSQVTRYNSQNRVEEITTKIIK
jgi:hypothetical protein